MKVSVFIRYALSQEDANHQCRRTEAYRSILQEYPSSKWERRHLETRRHNTGPMDRVIPDGPGDWIVEFEVTEK